MSDFFTTPARQAAVVEAVAHRPWPLPETPWQHAQTWEELGFLHWRVDEAELRPLLPEGLELDLHDGSAWLGITPFRVTGLRLRGLPPLPLVSTFPELNVRTYATAGGRPGIWFLSLDAGSTLAAEAAKRLYHLPYHATRILLERRHGHVHVDSGRGDRVFSAQYRGTGDAFTAEPGSLEWFLTERYCLYAADGEGLWRAEIHHRPWSLQVGEAVVELNTMAEVDGGPIVHYAARQDAVLWPVERI